MKPLRIIIFAKAPQAGLAKTRLIPALGAQGAADLAQRMLRHTLDTAMFANIGSVELCMTPSATDLAWRMIAMPKTVVRTDQGEGDLGARMGRAAQRAIGGGESVLLIGTDCPELSIAHLQQAAQALEHNDAVLLPTFDGGYALLGLNYFWLPLFVDIAWSTNTVALETLFRLAQLDAKVGIHRMLHDIDEPADLKWLPTSWLQPVNTGDLR